MKKKRKCQIDRCQVTARLQFVPLYIFDSYDDFTSTCIPNYIQPKHEHANKNVFTQSMITLKIFFHLTQIISLREKKENKNAIEISIEIRANVNAHFRTKSYRGNKISKRFYEKVTASSHRNFMRTVLALSIAQDLHDPFPEKR